MIIIYKIMEIKEVLTEKEWSYLKEDIKNITIAAAFIIGIFIGAIIIYIIGLF